MKKVMAKTAKGFYHFSYGLFVLCIAAIIIFGLSRWSDAEFIFATQKSVTRIVLIIIGAVFLSIFFVKLHSFLKKRSKKQLYIMIAVLSVIIVFLQILFLHILQISYLWDGVNVFSSAVSRLNGGDVVELYFSRYANQNGFLLITYALLKTGSVLGLAEGSYVFFLNICNTIFMDAAIVLASMIIYKIQKSDKKAVGVLLFLLVTGLNPFVYLWTAFYYTSILIMPFFLGIIYLVLCLPDSKKVWHKVVQAAAIGVLLAAAIRLRQTTVILAIALVIFFLLKSGLQSAIMEKITGKEKITGEKEKNNSIKEKISSIQKAWVLGLLAAVAAFLLCNAGIKSAENKINNLDTTDTAFPAIHWIMMGLDHGGEYNNQDADYTAGFATHQEKVDGDMELLVARLKHFGIKGISKTYAQKFLNTWVEASNAYPFRLSVSQEYTSIHDLVFGAKKDFVIYYHQIYQIFIMLFILIGAIKKWKEKKPDLIYVLHLSFLGTILFHLLWEAGPLYSVSLQVIYFLLAAYGILAFAGWKPVGWKPAESNGALSLDIAKNKKWTLRIFCIAGMLATVLFFGLNIKVFTEAAQEREKRVVNQYLASDNLIVEAGDVVTQTFLATRDFNYFNIHLCNHRNETNPSVYKLTVTGEQRGKIYEEMVYAKDFTGDYHMMRQIDRIVVDKPEKFTVTFEGIESGTDKNYVEIIYFAMKEYDPYVNGVFEKNGETLPGDLFLMISEKVYGPYTSVKRYLAVLAALLVAEAAIWLFAERGTKGKDEMEIV